GSANLTGSGVASLHVEAGISLDSRLGDPEPILREIANAVDAWFDGTRQGVFLVDHSSEVDRLVAQGVIAAVSPPRIPSTGGSRGGGEPSGRPSLAPLLRLPPVARGEASPPAVPPAP